MDRSIRSDSEANREGRGIANKKLGVSACQQAALSLRQHCEILFAELGSKLNTDFKRFVHYHATTRQMHISIALGEFIEGKGNGHLVAPCAKIQDLFPSQKDAIVT